jgi:hypothetical protein
MVSHDRFCWSCDGCDSAGILKNDYYSTTREKGKIGKAVMSQPSSCIRVWEW